MTCPKQDRPIVRDYFKFPLSHQETTSANLRIPKETINYWDYTLKGGIIMLKFEVIAGNNKRSKQVWIRISDDLKLIEWSESKLMLLFTRFKSIVEFKKKID